MFINYWFWSLFFLVQVLDTDKSGVVELNDITSRYDGSKHPDVLSGLRTNEDILRYYAYGFLSHVFKNVS